MRFRKLMVVAVAMHLVPVVAWATFKPVRVIAPALLDLHCDPRGVCVDDVARLPEALLLKNDAVDFVNARLGQIQHVPRGIFCATSQCAEQFGFTNQGAYNVGTHGFVISPRGWKPYFVRHELIHHLQNERLGSFNAWFFKPDWLKEGMAYSLSEDPRHPLPEPLEGWRTQFDKWHSTVGANGLWQAAHGVR